MIKIDTSTWKLFRVVDLGFSVYHGQRLNKAQRIEGETPFITAGFENRGVTQYIGNDRPIYHKAITVDMFGNCFFQSEDCAGDDNVYFFVNNDVNDPVKLFISAGIGAMTFAKFDYARQFRQGDADNLEVMLPATLDGEPDWAYMEAYMRDVMAREEIFAEHLASLTAEAVADGHVIDTSCWKAFRVGELFEVERGTRLTKANMEDGDIPFIGASAVDNGVTAFVGNDECLHKGHALTVCYNGSVGETFLQTDIFWASDDVNVLRPICSVSDASLMFVASCLKSLRDRYGYTNKWTSAKLVKDEIMLPATPDGDPDWAFMEAYMKSVMEREAMFADELDKLVM